MDLGLVIPTIAFLGEVRGGISTLKLDSKMLGVVVGVPHPSTSASRLEFITIHELLHRVLSDTAI